MDGQLQGTSDLLNNFPGSLTSVEMLLRYDTHVTLKVYRYQLQYSTCETIMETAEQLKV